MHYPKITLITPSFNQGQYIEETIRSVVEQRYPNLEYIIIDGGSKDGTIDILHKYDKFIEHWSSGPDQGQTDAINKGFELATGDIVNWLNSDDHMTPGSLQKIAEAFESRQTQGVSTVVNNFTENGSSWNELLPVQTSAVSYICRTYNNQPGTFFRKKVWDKYFPLPIQLQFVMDQYLWLCFWLEHQPSDLTIREFQTVNFRRHASSKTTLSTDIVFKNLGLSFFDEFNLLFWSFFKQFAPERAPSLELFFTNGINPGERQVYFPAGLAPTSAQCKEIFGTYLFELAKEDYRYGNTTRFRATVPHIPLDVLTSEERVYLKALDLKMRFAFFLKLYRRSYWAIKNKLFRS